MAKPPEPHEPFSVQDLSCWPMGASRVELDDGHPYFEGEFDADDVNTAERAFPWRRATLKDGALILHTSRCDSANCRYW